MSKKIKYIISLYIIVFITSCSFDKKTGIWSGSEKEKERISELERKQKEKIEVVKIYSQENTYEKEIVPTKNIILTKPKNNESWRMSNLNLQNFLGNIYLSGINNNFLKKKIGKNKFSLSKLKSTPLVHKDSIIMTDDKGTIFSISQKGKVNWKKNIYKKIYKKIYKNLSLAIDQDRIFVADNVGFIYAIDLYSGKVIWLKNHGVPFRSNLKIFDEKIFVINQDNRILCFNSKDGLKIWDVRTISSFIKSQSLLPLAISKDGQLFVLNSSANLFKLNPKDGRVFWTMQASQSSLAHDTDFFQSSEIVIDDKNMYFSTSTSLFSINSNNGYLNWKKDIVSKSISIIDGKSLFLVSNNGYFINLDKETGEINWSINILKILKKKKQKTLITGIVMGSGKIYATTYNGYLIVLSATSGKVENLKKIGGTIVIPPIISSGSLYILTEDSKIFGFN